MQTVLAKIVADKAIWVETRKQQQPLAGFQNRVSRARDIFMMRYRVRARRLFWSVQESVAVKRRDP